MPLFDWLSAAPTGCSFLFGYGVGALAFNLGTLLYTGLRRRR